MRCEPAGPAAERRLELERELVAEVYGRAAPTFAELVGTPFQSTWLTGPHRLAFEAAHELVKHGRVDGGSISPKLAAEEVRRHATGPLADQVQEAIEVAIEGYGGSQPEGGLANLVHALADVLAAEAAEEEKAAPAVPDLLSADRLFDTDFPPLAFAIDPILPRGELVEWVGPHGCFKSTLGLAAALSVATGRRFSGFPVTQGGAVFVTAEDSERTIAFRARAWLESIAVGPDRAAVTRAVRENFEYLAREHVRGLALTLIDYGTPGVRAGVVARLTELVRGAAVVFLETAAKLADGNENENRAQAAFAVALEEIAIDSGAAVVIVRHVSKQAARDDVTDSYAGRGGGALSDAARSIVNFTRPGPKNGERRDPLAPVVMTHAKGTHSRPAEPITWQPVEASNGSVYLRALSEDETTRVNGQKLLAVIPSEGITATDLHKHPPAGLSRGAARAALDFLLRAGSVVSVIEDRPRNKGATVYRRATPEAP